MRMRSLAVACPVTCLATRLATCVATCLAFVGCGGVYYAATVSSATTQLEHAREIGAETHAPYEYYFAKEHLKQAQIEASEASYSDAAQYAETCEEYADKAILLTQQATKAASE